MATTTTSAPVINQNNESAQDVFIFNNKYREKPAEDRNIVAKVTAAITILVVLFLNDELRLDNHNFQVVGGILLLQSIFEIVSKVEGDKASIITGFLFTTGVLAWYVLDDKTSSSTIILSYLLYLLIVMNIMFNNSSFECKPDPNDKGRVRTDRNIYTYIIFLCALNSLALLAFTYKDRDIDEYATKIFTVVLIGALVIIINIMTMLNTAYMKDLECDKVLVPTTTSAGTTTTSAGTTTTASSTYIYIKKNKQVFNKATTDTIKALMYNMVPLIATVYALSLQSYEGAIRVGIYMFITTIIVLTLSDYCPNTVCDKDDPNADNKVNEQMQKYKYMLIYALLLVAASCITDNSNDRFSLPILFAVILFAMLLSSFNFQDEGMRVGLPVGLVAITLVFIVIAKYARK